MKKVAFYLGYSAVGVLLILWPFALLGSVFLFDAPIRGQLDAASRFISLGAVVLFPLLYRKAWKRGKEALVEDDSILSILLPLIWPLLSPAWVIFAFTYVGPRVYGNG